MVLYAALVSAFVHERVDALIAEETTRAEQRGSTTASTADREPMKRRVNPGIEGPLRQMEEECGIAWTQLRHVYQGDRWVGLETVARLELAYDRRITGRDEVHIRLVRARRNAGRGS
ncbi:hypothetical protein CTKZ_08850 [Cellulomonas algicola]|uniref:Uncharacterized protein n=1 Tax=Cellulomonas algicola TaxID=2071633 RepID=A0A401UXC1_9CELL|nr:hypothetical protein [Cellulomonas algicola]GCD19323.1 hypothetical protein CTKZ_08850 [Cellulomonas algicola]